MTLETGYGGGVSPEGTSDCVVGTRETEELNEIKRILKNCL